MNGMDKKTVIKTAWARQWRLGMILVLAAGAMAVAQEPQVKLAGKAPDNRITVYLGRSEFIRPPWPALRVAVTDPKIADVRIVSEDQVLLQGKAVGTTDVLLWNDKDNFWRAQVSVEMDIERMKADLARIFPDCALTLGVSQDILTVGGRLGRAEQVQQLDKLLKAYGVKYVDMTGLAGVQQVMLQVRVAEVSRTAIRSLGINMFKTGDDFFGAATVGSSGGGPIQPVSIGPPSGAAAGKNLPFVFTNAVSVSPAVTLFGGFPDADLQVFIQALAENQYLRILAEPNLVAQTGADASFLAGGEFPIPVVQGSTSGSTAISIEYRKFGVQLKFRPVVLGDGTMRLYVAPEVSELSDTGAVQIQGFRIPSLVTRRAETTLELKNGQTFAIAGLISRSDTGASSRIPGLGDLPVLGAMFRSVRYTKGETEMVVLVTASLVEPLSTATRPPSPGMLDVEPNDWELYALGQVEGKGAPKLSSADAQWLRDAGLNRLKGPGAWVRYDSTAAPSRAVAPAPGADKKAGQSDSQRESK
jgi:pilus assembly protein CpaC